MEFQSTKGTDGASLPVPHLITNHSPAFQFCQVLLLTGGFMDEGRKNQRSVSTVH